MEVTRRVGSHLNLVNGGANRAKNGKRVGLGVKDIDRARAFQPVAPGSGATAHAGRATSLCPSALAL